MLYYVNVVIKVIATVLMITGIVIVFASSFKELYHQIRHEDEIDYHWLNPAMVKKVFIGILFAILSFLLFSISTKGIEPRINIANTVSVNITGADEIRIENDDMPTLSTDGNAELADLKDGTYTLLLKKSADSTDMVIELTPNDGKDITVVSRFVSVENETEFTFTIKNQEIIPQHRCVDKVYTAHNDAGYNSISWDSVPQALSYRVYLVTGDSDDKTYTLLGDTSDTQYFTHTNGNYAVVPVFSDGAGTFQYVG